MPPFGLAAPMAAQRNSSLRRTSRSRASACAARSCEWATPAGGGNASSGRSCAHMSSAVAAGEGSGELVCDVACRSAHRSAASGGTVNGSSGSENASTHLSRSRAARLIDRRDFPARWNCPPPQGPPVRHAPQWRRPPARRHLGSYRSTDRRTVLAVSLGAPMET